MTSADHAMPPGSLVKGPTALSGDAGRFVSLTTTLAFMEFKLRFFGSALGYFWQLMRPLLLFGVLFVVFTEFVRFNEGVDFFPVTLLMGIVLFTFFADATGGAVTSVVDRENLVRKIQFPRLVVPLSVVLTSCFNLLLNMVAVMVFALISGVDPHKGWVVMPFLILVLVLLATGVSALLSALFVRFRDVEPIWEVVVQVLFYGSPILYAIEVVPDPDIRQLLMLNPIAAILQQSRHWLIDPYAPSAAEAAGGAVWLLIPAALIIGAVILGLWVFSREAPRIAEEL